MDCPWMIQVSSQSAWPFMGSQWISLERPFTVLLVDTLTFMDDMGFSMPASDH